MVSHKIGSIFLVLFLLQTVSSKSLEDTSTSVDSSEEDLKKTATPSQQLFMYTFEHFVPLGTHFATNVVNASRYILKDESLMANTQEEVVKFRQNITTFVENYDAARGHIYTQDILNLYSNANYYYDRSGEKITPETTFVLGILNKYNCKDIVERFAKEFNIFLDNFVKMFEGKQANLEKPLLVWYEQYKTLTKFDEKFDAVSEFLKLA